MFQQNQILKQILPPPQKKTQNAILTTNVITKWLLSVYVSTVVAGGQDQPH